MSQAGTQALPQSLTPALSLRDGSAPIAGSRELWDVQSPVTGLIGTAVLLSGALGMALLAAQGVIGGATSVRYAVLLLLVFAAMAAFELFGRQVHHRQFLFSHARPIDRAARRCMAAKYCAIVVSVVLATCAFLILGEYAGRDYLPWFDCFAMLAPAALFLSPVYLFVCQRHGRWLPDDDELLHLARGYAALLRCKRPHAHFWPALRGIGVKFFFLPLMVIFWSGNTQAFESSFSRVWHGVNGFILTPANVALIFEFLQRGLILLDLALAVIGYACTMRLLDTHVRSAEPTLLGWAAALACYPPFSTQLTERYIAGVDAQQSWASYCGEIPGLFTMCACVILLLFTIYTASTIMFGLRFSNLTHRGVLCRGPYSVVRHPAYASKNLAWWIISMPFVRGPSDCIRLLCWNAIYVLRAWTEERHLMRDPLYREYARQVRWRFLPGIH